jgi:hypothetical protein
MATRPRHPVGHRSAGDGSPRCVVEPNHDTTPYGSTSACASPRDRHPLQISDSRSRGPAESPSDAGAVNRLWHGQALA